MRKGKLEEFVAPVNRKQVVGSVLRTEQSRDQNPQRARISASVATTGTAGKVPGKRKPSKAPAQFAPLPLQQARVLQQLQAISLNSQIATAPACGTLLVKLHPTYQTDSLPPHRRVTVSRQSKLQNSHFDSAGNTDSEVESPVSQPPTCKHVNQATAQPELHAQTLSETASASTPSRSAPQAALALSDSVADSPESMAMSTPACGQALPSSEASPAVPMSCSTGGTKPAGHFRVTALPPFGSPMCMSPDTWATPQQLQWELSSESVSALAASPQVQADAVPPTESQLQAANLEFGLDAIKAAGASSVGAGAKSRLASSTWADELSDPASSAGDSDQGYEGLHGDAEWLEDLEVTQSQSLPLSDQHRGSSDQEGLTLNLDSDEEDPLGLDASQVTCPPYLLTGSLQMHLW